MKQEGLKGRLLRAAPMAQERRGRSRKTLCWSTAYGFVANIRSLPDLIHRSLVESRNCLGVIPMSRLK
jgi:hypothetical protein